MNAVARRFRLTIAYDGTNYAGWQVQPRHVTVQQTIETALAAIVGHPCKLHGSGRTDQGVHAVGQVAHVDLVTRMDAGAVRRALNARLPPDVRIVRCARAAADFHARRGASSKEYRYFIWNDATMPPHRRLYTAHAIRPLDLAAMRAAAVFFVGRHDFAAFMANPNRAVESTVRTIADFTLARRGREICCRVRGDGFLYKQVRSMVGLLLRVGAGAEQPEAVSDLLKSAAPRTARVPSAPPQGLFLWRVWY
ncbi:MAG: tRNA pseudouridine(38-40) synthase TruA [Kiritimatiellae bacterium]|nr:tRNA pseudouridine(38-40) synthase TruA [Kiritimatiellia bacterium]